MHFRLFVSSVYRIIRLEVLVKVKAKDCMMMLKALALVAAVLAVAASTIGQERKDAESYDAWLVWSELHPMNGAVGAWAFCSNRPERTRFFGLGQPAGWPLIGVSVASESSLNIAQDPPHPWSDVEAFLSPMQIRFRVDQGEVLAGTGYLKRNGFYYVWDEGSGRGDNGSDPDGREGPFCLRGFSPHSYDRPRRRARRDGRLEEAPAGVRVPKHPERTNPRASCPALQGLGCRISHMLTESQGL